MFHMAFRISTFLLSAPVDKQSWSAGKHPHDWVCTSLPSWLRYCYTPHLLTHRLSSDSGCNPVTADQVFRIEAPQCEAVHKKVKKKKGAQKQFQKPKRITWEVGNSGYNRWEYWMKYADTAAVLNLCSVLFWTLRNRILRSASPRCF